jgi:hypothetical protein
MHIITRDVTPGDGRRITPHVIRGPRLSLEHSSGERAPGLARLHDCSTFAEELRSIVAEPPIRVVHRTPRFGMLVNKHNGPSHLERAITVDLAFGEGNE